MFWINTFIVGTTYCLCLSYDYFTLNNNAYCLTLYSYIYLLYLYFLSDYNLPIYPYFLASYNLAPLFLSIYILYLYLYIYLYLYTFSLSYFINFSFNIAYFYLCYISFLTRYSYFCFYNIFCYNYYWYEMISSAGRSKSSYFCYGTYCLAIVFLFSSTLIGRLPTPSSISSSISSSI